MGQNISHSNHNTITYRSSRGGNISGSNRQLSLSLMAPNATSGSSHLALAAAPEQLASWSGAERTWDPQSRESVTLKPGSLYRLPADEDVRYPESAVKETFTLSVGSLYRGSAEGEGGAEQRGGQDPDVQFIFTLPDEATLKAAASILKSLSSELTLEELCERACQSGANRKAEAQRLFQQHKAGGIGWSSEHMELFLDGLERAEICKIFWEQCKGPKHQE